MPASSRWLPAVVSLACAARTLVFPTCRRRELRPPATRPAVLPLVVVYHNDFNGPIGETFPEWTSSPITFHKTVTGAVGSVPAGAVGTVESPNRRERFLGEFGGPPIGRPGDPDWNHTRVDQTVRLSLANLPPQMPQGNNSATARRLSLQGAIHQELNERSS